MATATRAAAAGGITTLIDMPLNSAPCTNTPAELARKAAAAAEPNKTHVNVGFWAGLVPANAAAPGVLKALARGGALGFKAFMAPSGIDDFPHVSPAEVEAALPTIRALGLPLLVHAEIVDGDVPQEVGGQAPGVTGAYPLRVQCVVGVDVPGRPSGCRERVSRLVAGVAECVGLIPARLPAYPPAG